MCTYPSIPFERKIDYERTSSVHNINYISRHLCVIVMSSTTILILYWWQVASVHYEWNLLLLVVADSKIAIRFHRYAYGFLTLVQKSIVLDIKVLTDKYKHSGSFSNNNSNAQLINILLSLENSLKHQNVNKGSKSGCSKRVNTSWFASYTKSCARNIQILQAVLFFKLKNIKTYQWRY